MNVPTNMSVSAHFLDNFRIINSSKNFTRRIYFINFFGVLTPATTLFAFPIWIGVFTHLHLLCPTRPVLIYVRVVINLVTSRIDKRLAFVHKCSLNNATRMATVAAWLQRALSGTWASVFGASSGFFATGKTTTIVVIQKLCCFGLW